MRAVLAGLVALPFLLGAGAAAPAEAPEVVFTYQDPEIVESSGLAVVDGLFVTVNDSGDSARVFAVDPTDGYTVGVTYWNGDPEDDEAVAPAGPGRVWVADIGDNRAERTSIEVVEVPVGRGDRTVEAERHELVYPDGAHDAETLLSDPTTGRLLVVTKGVFGGTVYAAPAELGTGPQTLQPLGDVLGIATDGAFFPDGEHVVLRDYSQAVVYSVPSFEPVGSLELPAQDQGEGIAVDDEGRVYVGSEGRDSEVLRVRLPAELREAMGTTEPTATAESSPFPGVVSREGRELPEATSGERSAWPWFLTGWIAVAFLALLLRSLRRR